MTKYISAFVAAIWFLGVVGAPTLADEGPEKRPAVEEGQVIPAFEAVDDQGLVWKSSDHVGKKIVVLYFYPGDFTGGCIKQAETFRDGLARLTELGVEVVGVSGDSAPTHKLFKESHRITHTLLADDEGKLAEALGVPVGPGGKARTRTPEGQSILDAQGKSIIVQRGVTLPRWTFVIDKDGKLLSKRTKVNPATDAAEVEKLITP